MPNSLNSNKIKHFLTKKVLLINVHGILHQAIFTTEIEFSPKKETSATMNFCHLPTDQRQRVVKAFIPPHTV